MMMNMIQLKQLQNGWKTRKVCAFAELAFLQAFNLLLDIDVDNDLTGDTRALFSDIHLGGDSSSLVSSIGPDTDVRANQSPADDRRASSALSTRSRSIVPDDKVILRNSFTIFYAIVLVY